MRYAITPLFCIALFACGGTRSPAPATTEASADLRQEPGVDNRQSISLETPDGPLEVVAVHHGTLYLRFKEKVFWVDPWSKAPLEGTPKGDFVILTDTHPDHLDEAAITTVRTDNTVLVGPAAVATAMQTHKLDHVLANGESLDLGGLKLTAVPMYNLQRGPEPGKLFHDKGRGNGYRIEASGKVLYIAGDTECTDEMRAQTGVDLALVPMNLPYTMPPEEAAECVKAFRPRVVVPFHYRGSDLEVFRSALAGFEGVEVRTLPFYEEGQP